MTPQVQEKLKSIVARYEELTRLVSDPAVQADPPTYRTHSKALADMQDIVDAYREFQTVDRALTEARELAAGGDADMQALALEEVPALEARITDLDDRIRVLLIPRDPNDDRN